MSSITDGFPYDNNTGFVESPSVGSGGGRAERGTPNSRQSSAAPGTGSKLSPRVRFVAERGSGNHGTAYNKLDWEVLDKDRNAGSQVICRTTQSDARLITYALNHALPSRSR